MKVFLITAIFIFAVFLQMIIPLPFVLLAILLLGILFKEAWIFPTAFFAGIFLDVLSFRTVGLSSNFFVIILGVMYLYQRKFEIQTMPFLFVISFISTFFYFLFLVGSVSIVQTLLSSFLAAGIFWMIVYLQTGKRKSYQFSH